MEEAEADLRKKGKSEDDIAAYTKMFTEVFNAIDSKQLRPTMRTQYMRVAFQRPYVDYDAHETAP